MSLYKKLLIAPLAAVAMMMIFGIVTTFTMDQQNAALNDVYGNRLATHQSITKASEAISTIHSRVYRLITWIANYNQEKIQLIGGEISSELEAQVAVMNKFSARSDISAEEKKLAQAITAQLAKYRKNVADGIDLATGDVNMSMMFMQTTDDAFLNLRALFSQLVTLENKLNSEQFELATRAFHKAAASALVALIVAIVISVLLTGYMSNRIVKPIQKATSIASQISQGDLTTKVEVTTGDETGQLLFSLNAMQDNLRQIIKQITDAAEHVSMAAGELSTTAREIATSSQQQSTAASTIAASIEELTASTERISDSTKSAKEVVQQTTVVTLRGQTQIEHAALEITRIAEKVHDSTQVIHQLQLHSNEISGITGVIKGITDQTNLLALNASIEASRAGDQGRGFLVVADEVRKLATRTTDATSKIKTIADNARDETHKAVASMEEGSSQIGRGVGLVNELIAPLRDLHQGASAALDRLTELAHATTEQNSASTEIARSVEKIAQMAEENQATVDQGTQSAARLERLAEDLLGASRRFRI